MSWRRPPRLGPEAIELLDAGAGTAEEEAEAYRLLGTVNERLGGYRTTFRALDGLLDAGTSGPPFLLVDVAGGDGAFAARLVTWAESRGRRARGLVIDLNATALEVAGARTSVAAVRAHALRLPLADRAAECVHCSSFFHHLGVAEALDLLAEMCRASRRLVVVNDLVRSRLATGAIWALTRLLTDNRLVRYDGPLSVRKSFLPGELMAIAHAAGSREASDFRWSIVRQFPYRMALVGARLAGT